MRRSQHSWLRAPLAQELYPDTIFFAPHQSQFGSIPIVMTTYEVYPKPLLSSKVRGVQTDYGEPELLRPRVCILYSLLPWHTQEYGMVWYGMISYYEHVAEKAKLIQPQYWSKLFAVGVVQYVALLRSVSIFYSTIIVLLASVMPSLSHNNVKYSWMYGKSPNIWGR